MVTYRLPLRLASLANQREHWTRTAERAKAHKKATLVIQKHSLPCVVTITRMGPRLLDEHDNLRISCKPLVDGIAARLGVDDADSRVTWRYTQDKSPEYEAIVTIEPRRGEVEVA